LTVGPIWTPISTHRVGPNSTPITKPFLLSLSFGGQSPFKSLLRRSYYVSTHCRTCSGLSSLWLAGADVGVAPAGNVGGSPLFNNSMRVGAGFQSCWFTWRSGLRPVAKFEIVRIWKVRVVLSGTFRGAILPRVFSNYAIMIKNHRKIIGQV